MSNTPTIEQLIAGAEEKAAEPKSYGYGCFSQGPFQVYLVPVQQRTQIRRQHYRATFYLQAGEQWKRCSRNEFEKALQAHKEF